MSIIVPPNDCLGLTRMALKELGLQMPETSPDIAATVLDVLRAVDVRFALLHNEKELAAGNLRSDVDLAIDRPPMEAMRIASSELSDRGVLPVLAWPYDVGGTSIFLVNHGGTASAQLDFSFDPAGRGTYGLRTALIIERAVAGDRWPRADPRDERAYLVVKRCHKGESDALYSLMASDDPITTQALAARTSRIVGEITRSGLLAQRTFRPMAVREIARRILRIVKPVGLIVRVLDSDLRTVEALGTHFAGLLPHVSWSTNDFNTFRRLRLVARAKIHAGVHISTDLPKWIPTDIRFENRGSLAANAAELVDRAAARLLRAGAYG